MNEVLDVWPNRPNQKIVEVYQVFTERASRRRGGELFIRDDYTGKLVKYTSAGLQSVQKSSEPPNKKQKVGNVRKSSRNRQSQCSSSSARSVPPPTTPRPRSKSVVEKQDNRKKRSSSLAPTAAASTLAKSSRGVSRPVRVESSKESGPLDSAHGETSTSAKAQPTPTPRTLSLRQSTRAKTPTAKARNAARSTSVKNSSRGQRTPAREDNDDDVVTTPHVTSAKKGPEGAPVSQQNVASYPKGILKKTTPPIDTEPPLLICQDPVGEPSNSSNKKRKIEQYTSPEPKCRRSRKTSKVSQKIEQGDNTLDNLDIGGEQLFVHENPQPSSKAPIENEVEQAEVPLYGSDDNAEEITKEATDSSIEPIPTDPSLLAVAIWPLAEKPERLLSRVDAGIRSLSQFDERHADILWTVLNLVDLDDLMEMEVIRNISHFYEHEVIPAICNFKQYLNQENRSADTSLFHDDNRGEYEEFIDDDNEGTVTIPLPPRPEVFPFQMFRRQKLTKKSTPSSSTESLNATFSNLLEESRRQMSEHQRQMDMFIQQQQEILNNMTAFSQPSFQTPFLNLPTPNLFASPLPNLFQYLPPQFPQMPLFQTPVFNTTNPFNLNLH